MEIDYSKDKGYLHKLKVSAYAIDVSFEKDGERLYGILEGCPLVRKGADPVCLIRCDNGRYYVIKEKDVKWNDKREM